MPDYEQAVFISYAWGKEDDEHESIVNLLDKSLQNRRIKMIRDRRDLGYKGSISQFMERIGQGNCVIVVISDKYLKSQNCMFELVEIADGKQFHDRIFPIVLADADIYDPMKRIGYIKHWEAKRTELAAAIKDVDPANLQGIREDMDLYDRIRDKISGLTSILKDMNAFTADLHIETDFSKIYDAIEQRMKEAKSASSSTRTSEVRDNLRASHSVSSERQRTISVAASSGEELGTIHLRKLEDLETHQSSLRTYVEGYLLLSERWDQCGTAKSILLEKGINKIKAKIPLDLRDLGEIRSSLSNASMNKVLSAELLSDDLQVNADTFAQEMQSAKQEIEKLVKLIKPASPTKMEKMDLALHEALFHLDNSISAIKHLIEICGTKVRTEIGHIEGLINEIVHSQKAQKLPSATEYSATINRDRTSLGERNRTVQGAGAVGRSSVQSMESNAT